MDNMSSNDSFEQKFTDFVDKLHKNDPSGLDNFLYLLPGFELTSFPYDPYNPVKVSNEMTDKLLEKEIPFVLENADKFDKLLKVHYYIQGYRDAKGTSKFNSEYLNRYGKFQTLAFVFIMMPKSSDNPLLKNLKKIFDDNVYIRKKAYDEFKSSTSENPPSKEAVTKILNDTNGFLKSINADNKCDPTVITKALNKVRSQVDKLPNDDLGNGAKKYLEKLIELLQALYKECPGFSFESDVSIQRALTTCEDQITNLPKITTTSDMYEKRLQTLTEQFNKQTQLKADLERQKADLERQVSERPDFFSTETTEKIREIEKLLAKCKNERDVLIGDLAKLESELSKENAKNLHTEGNDTRKILEEMARITGSSVETLVEDFGRINILSNALNQLTNEIGSDFHDGISKIQLWLSGGSTIMIQNIARSVAAEPDPVEKWRKIGIFVNSVYKTLSGTDTDILDTNLIGKKCESLRECPDNSVQDKLNFIQENTAVSSIFNSYLINLAATPYVHQQSILLMASNPEFTYEMAKIYVTLKMAFIAGPA